MRVLLKTGEVLEIKVDSSIPSYPEINLELDGKKADIGLIGRRYHTTTDGERIVTSETIEEIISNVEDNLIIFKEPKRA
jgi:hypothetical protein